MDGEGEDHCGGDEGTEVCSRRKERRGRAGGEGTGSQSPTQEKGTGGPQLDHLLGQESACSNVHLRSLMALRRLKG